MRAAPDDREVEPAQRAVPRRVAADVDDDADRRVREQRDDRAAGGEAVDPVGEVDAVRRPRDHEEDQHVEAVRELDVPVHDRDEDVRRQLLVAHGEHDPDRDQREQEHLPAAAQPERPAVGQLDEVVEEPDGSAPERDEEDRQRRDLVLRHREEGGRRNDEHEQPAHGRRPLLDLVRRGPLLADVLAELVPAQERDEAGADDQRQHHCDHARDEDADHAVGTLASASAIASSPTARDALTSTASPGRTTSSSSRSASWTFGVQRPGTPPSR